MEAAWVLFVGTIAAIAVGAALVANRTRGASHPRVDVAGLGFSGGLVVFTSTDCADCTALMERLRGREIQVREITFELEPLAFEQAGVTGVPLTVAVDSDGVTVGQVAGLPRAGMLARLIRKSS